MRQVGAIVHAVAGRMREQDVKSAVPPEREPQPPDAAVHFALCILVDAVLVADRAAQTEDAHALVAVDLVLNVDAAERRAGFVDIVVIAMHIEDRRV